LWARDQAVEAWLQTEVAEAYDALVADPSRGIDADTLRAHLTSERAAAQ
jgi:antitoxin ParD1/3/4